MELAHPLPAYLVERYHGWQSTALPEALARYHHLADEGQSPQSMIIACCDSRISVSAMFGESAGDFFTHRNIANFVPPYSADGDSNGTSAAIEYAVTALKVSHLVVMGHSKCGGVAGCHALCSGNAPELADSFVGRWVAAIKPGYDRVADLPDDEQLTALEREATKVSLENLMTFPFVKEAVEAGTLTLHALWIDIREGELLQLRPETGGFEPV